jgi:hypothetical protein
VVTGWDLHATLAEQARELEHARSQPPVACPNDGTPLQGGPPRASGVLYCPHDGWQYPRDWDPETMAGM